jgi:hypothetical protein
MPGIKLFYHFQKANADKEGKVFEIGVDEFGVLKNLFHG